MVSNRQANLEQAARHSRAPSTTRRPDEIRHRSTYSDPEKAARKLLEIANSVEVVQHGRIYIQLINGPFLFREKGIPPNIVLTSSWRSIAAGCGSTAGRM